MLIFLRFILSDIVSQCLSSKDGLVLTKYYRDTCPHCQRITPLLEDVHNNLQKNKIKIQIINVECSKCNCSVANIDAVPTIILSRDGKELGKFRGFQEYNFIADFVAKKAGIKREIFDTIKKTTLGQVFKLKVSDFYTAFQGPWIIHFFKDEDDVKRQMIKEIADIYAGKIQVGEISKDDAESIEVRYNIQGYPTILGLYGNTNVEFKGDNLPMLMDFCDKLLEPNLIDTNYDDLSKRMQDIKNGEPIFLIFHSNIQKVNAYFDEIAGDFKFRVKFYKTTDQKIFEMAGIHPTNDNKDKENNDVIMVVYRNGVFYKYTDDLNDRPKIYNWLFNAHYSHVSLFSDKNFHSLFRGVKPLVFLFTHNDELVDSFESVSRDRHLGVPFASEIFVAVDLKDYSTFAKIFFKGHQTPGLLIYDPMTRQAYSENRKINKDNIIFETHKMLRLYDTGKLPLQNHWRIGYKWILLMLIGGLVSGLLINSKNHSMKID